jgi:ribosomal peptide maturation radical SAM protein 1
MKVALVALPWSAHNRPSAALGALKTHVALHRPQHQISSHYLYLQAVKELGAKLYAPIARSAYILGELLYAQLVYPEKSEDVRAIWLGQAERDGLPSEIEEAIGEKAELDQTFDRVKSVLERGLDAWVASRDWSDTVVGMTTSFGQLFANIAMAKRLKARYPSARVVLGGSTVSGATGASILREYPELIDFIVQGEGELPFVALLDHIETGGASALSTGVLSHDAGAEPGRHWEHDRMDELAIPDYDEYFATAREIGVRPLLPMEGSRGCWWDRTKKKRTSTCYFCNLNIQWNGYREKSAARIAQEMQILSEKYQLTEFFFLDNIIRAKGIDELAREIGALPGDVSFFYEARAHISAGELLSLWEVGLREVQFGIEALSTSLLERINKGTTTIQNLEVMKTLRELGIASGANLIVNFPGSTQAEVHETVDVIRRYAIVYEPLHAARFWLSRDSVVHAFPERFGIGRIRNRDTFRAGVPDDVLERLELFDLDFDYLGPPARWDLVREAIESWEKAYKYSLALKRPLLRYFDGGSFLRIEDDRPVLGNRSIILSGASRELYLWCCSTRRIATLERQFCEDDEDRNTLHRFIERMTAQSLMFREGDRVLSVACAVEPHLAARRIRSQRQAEEASPPARPPLERRPSLAVVGQEVPASRHG